MNKDTITLAIFKKNVNNLYKKNDDFSILDYFEQLENSIDEVVYSYLEHLSEIHTSLDSREKEENLFCVENCFYLLRLRKLLLKTIAKANKELDITNEVELN